MKPLLKITKLYTLFILAGAVRVWAQLNIQDADVALKILVPAGQVNGHANYRAERITGRDYLTQDEIQSSIAAVTSLGGDGNSYSPIVPYIVASGAGAVSVNFYVTQNGEDKVLGSSKIEVRLGESGNEHAINILYNRSKFLDVGNYGMTFIYNGQVYKDIKFRVVSDARSAEVAPQASPKPVSGPCPWCEGRGYFDNWKAKTEKLPNGSIRVLEKVSTGRSSCSYCDGSGIKKQ